MQSSKFLANLQKNKLPVLFLSLSLILYCIIIYNGFFKPFIGFDDYYTLGIVRLSFMDMINTTATNVHPPLYYIIFKIFKNIFNPTTNLSLILIGKLVSIIPLGLLLILAWTKIRKQFGILVSGIFSLLICSSFQVMYFSTVIRMYSWALLFLTIQLVFMYDLLRYPSTNSLNTKSRNSYTISWIVFTIAAICSAYTHYFSAISSILIYLLLLFYFLIKNRSQIKIWIISVIISVLAYLPWLNVLFNQILNVKANYWIKPITINTIINYFQFIFSPVNSLVGTVLSIILILILIVSIFLVYSKEKLVNAEKPFVTIAISLIFLTIISGITLSFLIRPICVERYFLPCFGSLILGFSILISKLVDDKKIFYIIIIFMLIFAAVGCSGFINETNSSFNNSNIDLEFLNSINNGETVIINDGLSNLRYSPFLDNDYIIFSPIDEAISNTTLFNSNNQNIIIFDKHHQLDSNTSNFKKIGIIHQDTVYLFKNHYG